MSVLVRWPRAVTAGSRSLQVIAWMDWAPTLLAAAAAQGLGFDGANLLPVLLGDSPPVRRKLFWRFNRDDQAAVRDGDWKYLRRRGREYLFDVAVDPRERANLKLRHPDIFAGLQRDFARWNETMMPYSADSVSAGGGPGGRWRTIEDAVLSGKCGRACPRRLKE